MIRLNQVNLALKNVILRAPVLTQSGYGVHSRQIARWLIEKAEKNEIMLTIQCVPWGDTSWYLNGELEDGLIEKIMRYSSSNPGPFDVSIQNILPNEWDPSLANFNIGISAGVETDKCHDLWVEAVNAMDMVIVPSTHTRDTFLKTGSVNKKIHVVPESYPDCFRENSVKDKFDFEAKFNFLVFGQFGSRNPDLDRKNIINTLKWLIEEFKDDPEVGILLKTNLGRSTVMDYKQIQGVITDFLSSIGHRKYPVFQIIHGHLENEDVRDLYANDSVRCLVSLTRGEGFGLPLMEAAAMNVPVIATGWSAHKDYLENDSYQKVKYDLVPVPKERTDEVIFREGSKWANPKEKSAKECFRKMKNHSGIYEKRASSLSEKIIKSHSFESICAAYDEVTKSII